MSIKVNEGSVTFLNRLRKQKLSFLVSVPARGSWLLVDSSLSNCLKALSTHIVYGGDKEQHSGGHVKKDDEEEDDQHGVCLRRPSADS